jgi:hypothetical protein
VKQAEQAERACHNLRQTWHRRVVPLAASKQGCAPVSAAVSASAPRYVPVPRYLASRTCRLVAL